MQYCPHCKLSVCGQHSFCPLCQGVLMGNRNPEDEIFPHVKNDTPQYHFLIRILIFASVVSVIICISVNIIFPGNSNWSLFVTFAIICMWICLYSVLRRRRNISKNIIWMVFWLSLLAILWDFFTGWRGWAFDYVIPCICVFAMISMAVIARALELMIDDYLIYIILDALFGIIPLLFLLFGWVRITYPSVLCVAISTLSLVALLLFRDHNFIDELKKRLHL